MREALDEPTVVRAKTEKRADLFKRIDVTRINRAHRLDFLGVRRHISASEKEHRRDHSTRLANNQDARTRDAVGLRGLNVTPNVAERYTNFIEVDGKYVVITKKQ